MRARGEETTIVCFQWFARHPLQPRHATATTDDKALMLQAYLAVPRAWAGARVRPPGPRQVTPATDDKALVALSYSLQGRTRA